MTTTATKTAAWKPAEMSVSVSTRAKGIDCSGRVGARQPFAGQANTASQSFALQTPEQVSDYKPSHCLRRKLSRRFRERVKNSVGGLAVPQRHARRLVCRAWSRERGFGFV